MRILTASQSRTTDRRAIEELNIPSLVLMENAALGLFGVISKECPQAEEIAVLCGPGNNGGDGLAVARHLATHGYGVQVAVLASADSLSPDATAQLQMVRELGDYCPNLDLRHLPTEEDLDAWFAALPGPDLLVDALFGTGLSRPLEGRFQRALALAEQLPAPVLAVDLPSGLDADDPALIGPSLAARWTVTFEAPKLAHLLPPADALVGDLIVCSLGLPEGLGADGENLSWLDRFEAVPLRPRRAMDGHKGSFGHLRVVAGSPGKSGAAILAARAAIRSGAGLVTVATPTPCVGQIESGSVESMTLELPATLHGEAAASSLALLLADDRSTALAVGPGLGAGSETGQLIREYVVASDKPLVLDADGLNAFSGRIEELSQRREGTVLTPHPGELSRLLACAVPSTSLDRIERVREAAAKASCVVVLKGFRTLIARPDGALAISSVGNDGLATGGSGDVLTGVVGAFLARDVSPWDAARLGVYLHGRAADLYVEQHAPESLSAGLLIQQLDGAIRELEG